MTMNILNADYWTSYLQPYVADVGVAMVFGIGYYLFRKLQKDDTPMAGPVKEKLKSNISK